MSLPKAPSTNISSELHRIDSRLTQLQDVEDGLSTADISQAPVQSTRRSPITSDMTEEETVAESSQFPSSLTTPTMCGTPYEPSSEDSEPVATARPRMNSFGRQQSIVQVKKEEKTTWHKYPRKGYKVTTKYFYQEIDSSWTAVLLVACFFVSGLTDSVAFSVWNVFVAMQTGNTIFLALRISGQPTTHHPLNFVKCLTSVVFYCLGALCFNCLHRAPTGLSDPSAPLHRWTLLTSFVIQSGLLLIAAVLAQTSVLSTEVFQGGGFSPGTVQAPGDNYLDLIGIALMAFEAAGQVCLSRVLLVNELPTIVLSTLYHDLIGEALGMRRCWKESATKWEFLVTQKKQIRRIACILSLFTGALIGGFVFQSRGGLAGALWLAAGIKIGICIAWCLWKKKMVVETVVTDEKR